MTYKLFCQSVRGASHIRKDIPCQDFGMKKDCGEYKIFATADGHGDPRCIRSHIGSRKICEIAHEDLETFARTVREQGWEGRLFHPQEAWRLVRQLINCMVGKWIEAVGEEYENNPLTEAEKQRCEAGSRVERMYGTTLIAGLQTEQYLLLLQQGDGRCVVFDGDGSASQPIPWDDSCVGNATTSLCDIDAAQRFRFHVIDLEKAPVIACVAGTDGVEDSFPSSMEKTHAYYRGLLRYACEKGVPALEEYLAEELCDLSTRGSADDVTVSGIVDVERVNDFLDQFEKEDHRVELEDQVAALESKLNSIREGGKLQHLEKVWKDAKEAYQKANNRFEEAKRSYDAAASEYQKAQSKFQAAKKELDDVRQRHQEVDRQYEEADRRYQEARGQWKKALGQYKAFKKDYNAKKSGNPTAMEALYHMGTGLLQQYKQLNTETNNAYEHKNKIKKEKNQAAIAENTAAARMKAAQEKVLSLAPEMNHTDREKEDAAAKLCKAEKEHDTAKKEYQSYQERNADIQLNLDKAKEELENFRKSKN